MNLPGAIVVMVSLAVGWMALFPVRDKLGATAYHLLSYPVGLLAWGMVAAVAGLFEAPYTGFVVGAGLTIFALASGVLFRAIGGSRVTSLHEVPWWGYVLVGALTLGVLAPLGSPGVFFITDDSYMAYELLGLWLMDTGVISLRLMSERAVLIPAIHAATRFFGGNMAYVHYPVLSGYLVGLVAYALSRTAFSALKRRYVLSIFVACVMATMPVYIFQSLYVHSHMVSATYLFIAILGVERARSYALASEKNTAYVWLGVTGLTAAGFVLSRPDGLAYVFVVAIVVLSLYFRKVFDRRSLGSVAVLFAAYVFAVFGVAFWKLGLWSSGKLDGPKSAGLLILLGMLFLVSATIGRSTALTRFLGSRERVLSGAVAVSLLGVLIVGLSRPGQFVRAVRNMMINLLHTGGYHSFWYVVVAVIVLIVIFHRQKLWLGWYGYLAYALVQFFLIAMVVHGALHPGRLSVSDSFNRIAFHTVPLVFWFIGYFVAAVLSDARLTKVVRPHR